MSSGCCRRERHLRMPVKKHLLPKAQPCKNSEDKKSLYICEAFPEAPLVHMHPMFPLVSSRQSIRIRKEKVAD